MALNSLGLGFVFTAKDLASGTMRKVEGNFRQLDTTSSRSAKNFNKNVGMAVAGLAVAAGGAIAMAGAFKLAGNFGTFEQGLAKVGAITRASAADMELLRERAIQAGIETQFSPDEAVQGLEALGLRGFTTAESMDALGGALDLAAGGQIGVEQAASTTASALRVFGMEADRATEASDKLLKISNLTAISAGDLELMLGTVARGASATKQSLDEMLVSMGLVKNTGVDASVAASAVSSALQFVAKNQDQFKQLGVSVTDADGNFRDFIDIVTDTNAVLGEKFPNAADRTSKGLKLFGRFGVAAFQAVSTQLENGIKDAQGNLLVGADAVAYLRKEMGDAAGTAAKFREQLLDTFEGQKTLLKGSLQTLGIVTGEAFAAVFKPLVSVVINVVNAIIAVMKNLPGPVKKAIGAIFVLTAAFVTIGGLVMAAVAGFALLKMAVIAFSGPLLAAAGGLAAVSAAALVLVGLFKVLRKAFDENIGGFGDSISRTFGKVKLFFDAIKMLTSGDGRLRGNVLKELLDPANESILTMVQRFQQARHRVSAFFQGISDGYNTIMRGAGPTFKALSGAVKELFEALGFGGKGMELMTSKSEDFRQKGEVFGRIVGHIAKLLVAGLTVAVRVATGAIEGMKAAWKIIGPILRFTATVFMVLVNVVESLIGVFSDGTEAANEQGGAFDKLAKVVGYAVGIFVAFKGVMIAARMAVLVYRGVIMAASLAQAAFSAVAAGGALAFLGPAGLVIAVAAAAYALGSYIDKVTGASDAISDWMLDITGVTAELEKLDEAYRKTIKTRGQVAAFGDLEEAAAAQGMSVTAYAEQRATKIAGESTAQRLGLSKDEIKRRLMAGEDVYKELSGPPKPPADAADGVVAAADGEANKGKAAARQQQDAFEQALLAADGKGKPIQLNVTTKIGDEEVAKLMKTLEAQAASLDFEADVGALGEF